MTPPHSTSIALWLRSIPVGDVAFVMGACGRVIAEAKGMSEAELLADFARRAAQDPDASRPAR